MAEGREHEHWVGRLHVIRRVFLVSNGDCVLRDGMEGAIKGSRCDVRVVALCGGWGEAGTERDGIAGLFWGARLREVCTRWEREGEV